MAPVDLSRIFKAYDVRGTVPDELNADVVRRIGAAFAGWSGATEILVGRDARLSSPELAAALIEGATSRDVDVVDLGLASTDLLYFASGSLDRPGVMITASHNPKQYNGLKFCLARAKPVGEESGLGEIRALTEKGDEILGTGARHGPSARRPRCLRGSRAHVHGRGTDATPHGRRGHGERDGGLVVPAVMERLPVTLHHLYADLDGTFPNHPADPIDPENQRDLKRAVLEHRADLGMAFDGDADRVFLVDEHADDVSGSVMTALIAAAMLEREPGAKVVHNLICSWTVPEVIREHGGEPIRTRVGHSFIKQVMAETGAIFGGEHSGHYYFRDNYGADSGLIAAVIALGELSAASEPLSGLLAQYRRYASSGEINSRVEDPEATIEEIAEALRDGRQDRLDGLTVEFDDWWCNVRPSNTEPLLRLNVEARTDEILAAKTATVLAVIGGGGDDAGGG